MKRFIMAGTLVMALGLPALASAQAAKPAAGTSLGTITLTHKVMADGKPLMAGTYQVRLTGEDAKPGPGQSPDAERYVEFVRGGKVVARELATVIPSNEIEQVAKSRRPAPGTSKVEKLKGDDYVRVWINRGGTNYIINMPAAG
jgi:hypothetical protein